MLSRAISILMVAAVLGGQPAMASKPGTPPPGQVDQNGPPPDDQGPPPGPPPPRSRSAPPEFAAPQPPPGRIVVLTEHQKRCGAQRRCELDSRTPCPPCW